MSKRNLIHPKNRNKKTGIKERILNTEERDILIECITDIAVLTKIYKDTMVPLLLILKEKGYITDEDLTSKQDELGIKRNNADTNNSDTNIKETDKLQIQSEE